MRVVGGRTACRYRRFFVGRGSGGAVWCGAVGEGSRLSRPGRAWVHVSCVMCPVALSLSCGGGGMGCLVLLSFLASISVSWVFVASLSLFRMQHTGASAARETITMQSIRGLARTINQRT